MHRWDGGVSFYPNKISKYPNNRLGLNIHQMNLHTLHKAFAVTVVIIVATSLACCSGCGAESPLSAEQLRVEHACRIDTSLCILVDPDTIGMYSSLDALTAESWIVVDDSSGLLLSSKDADRRMFPASLTKMMTCLLALEHGCLTDTVIITPDIFVTTDATVRPGYCFTLQNLLSEMMLQSDNVSACAVARHIAGDTLAFVDMMNRKAAYLHMDSTHFANPNGLPNDSNYSTAHDLLVLTRYCMSDSVFAQIVATPYADLPLTDGRHIPCWNTNQLLTRYEGCIGVKTGFTRSAGSCLSASCRRHDGSTLTLVLLKSKSHESRFAEARLLFDYGFSVMDALDPARHD